MKYVALACCPLALSSLILWGILWHIDQQEKAFDPGCTSHWIENDPTSRVPRDGDVVEFRCVDNGTGHLRLRARVKPVQP